MTAGTDANASLWVSSRVWVLAAGCVHLCVYRHGATVSLFVDIASCYIVKLHLCLSLCVSSAPGQHKYGSRSPGALCQEPLALNSLSRAEVSTPT